MDGLNKKKDLLAEARAEAALPEAARAEAQVETFADAEDAEDAEDAFEYALSAMYDLATVEVLAKDSRPAVAEAMLYDARVRAREAVEAVEAEAEGVLAKAAVIKALADAKAEYKKDVAADVAAEKRVEAEAEAKRAEAELMEAFKRDIYGE